MDAQYTCEFGEGVSAVATIDINVLNNMRGKVKFYDVKFTGQPAVSMLDAYRKWILMIHRAAADLIGEKILWVFQVSRDKVQLWECAPGVDPVMVNPDKVLPPRPEGKEGCPRCHGRGYIGRDMRTKSLIDCSCVR